jgi:methylmalonyl-CoA mutase N-terminal domain/subunit
MKMKMLAGGGGGGLTIEQPENNIVRGAYYALISALSGTQTMALCSFDEAYTIPSEKAALISLRTMQILIDEMGIGDTVDPLAGSYYVESLTNEMEARIVGEMKRVDEAWGGIVHAVSEGIVQAEVARQAFQYEHGIQNGSIPKVGVNRYRMEEGARDVEMHPYDEKQAEESVRRTAAVIAGRDPEKVARALQKVSEAASGDQNTMPAMMEAVRAYATLGEITRELKKVFGTFREPVRF